MVGWLGHWLVGWLVGCLVGWLVGRLVGWLVSGAAVVSEPGHAPLKGKWDSAAKLNSWELTLPGEFEDVFFPFPIRGNKDVR